MSILITDTFMVKNAYSKSMLNTKMVFTILICILVTTISFAQDLTNYNCHVEPTLDNWHLRQACDCTEEEIEETILDTLLVRLFIEQEYLSNQIIDTSKFKAIIQENGEILNFQLTDNYPDLLGKLVYQPEIIILEPDFFPKSSVSTARDYYRLFYNEFISGRLSNYVLKDDMYTDFTFNLLLFFNKDVGGGVGACGRPFSVVGPNLANHPRYLKNIIQHEMGHNLGANHELENASSCSGSNNYGAYFPVDTTIYTNGPYIEYYSTNLSYLGGIKFPFYSTGGQLKVPLIYLEDYYPQVDLEEFITRSIGNSRDTLVYDCCTEEENNLFNAKYNIQRMVCERNKTCLPLNTNNFIDKMNIQVYPNPSDEYFNIRLNKTGDVDFSMQSADGNQVIEQKILNADHQINVKHLPSGMYLLKFATNEESRTVRVFKN